MGATQSAPTSPSQANTTTINSAWACCSGRAGKVGTLNGTSPESPESSSTAGAGALKDSAPLPDHYYNNVTTARALAAANLFDDNNDDEMLVAPAAYPVTVTLRMRRASIASGCPQVRVHILINDLRSYNYRTPNAPLTTINVGAGSGIGNGIVHIDEQTTPEQSSTETKNEYVEIDIQPIPDHQITPRRKQAEASAAILLSYLTQTWPNQKVLDGWVDTSYQPLPAPNQSDTKFKVECNLPFTPRQVIEALATFSPSVARLKWDSAIQSYTELEVIDENTRIIAACTKAVNAGFASVESREFIDLSLCRQLTTNERKAIRDARPPTAEPIPAGEWWMSTVCADDSSSTRPVTPTCVRATNYPNGVIVYPAPNNTSRVMLVVYSELQLGWKKSFLRTTMPSELKTMMTRLRNHLQACYPSSSGDITAVSPTAPTPSIPASPSIVASPTAVSSTGNTASPAHKLP